MGALIQLSQTADRCTFLLVLDSKSDSNHASSQEWTDGSVIADDEAAAPPPLAHDDVIGEAIHWTEERDIKLKVGHNAVQGSCVTNGACVCKVFWGSRDCTQVPSSLSCWQLLQASEHECPTSSIYRYRQRAVFEYHLVIPDSLKFCPTGMSLVPFPLQTKN